VTASNARQFVIVPGHGGSGPRHWQTLFERSHPGVIRVNQKSWTMASRTSWVEGLERALGETRAPAILIGHSLGAMTIVHGSAQSIRAANVAGALLVAPPDTDVHLPGMPAPWLVRLAGWTPVPMRRLPWKSTLVASANDPMCSLARSRAFADAWGCRFVEIGAAGHVDAEAGFGPWPGLEALLDDLIA
jgi:predicted alpha/beta hydrolase family esterase